LSGRRLVAVGISPLLILAGDRFIAAEGSQKSRRIAMNNESTSPTLPQMVQHELQHMKNKWCWFLLLGILLVLGGTAAIIVPLVTAAASLVAVIVVGVVLMISGAGVIIESVWAGKWSGMLLHLLVGVLYVVVGFIIIDRPIATVVLFTGYVAAIFILLGSYRIIAALAIRFPQWGWTLLNGVVTLLAGVIIYRHFSESIFWVIGLLVGLEMLFNGWAWIMLALGLRKLPVQAG
jgi:uncharacterized membrane protein HdeD (DUF308 family)